MRDPIEEGILYVGPVKVKIEAKFIEGTLVLVKRGKNNIIGYPSLFKGECFAQYNLNHLHTNLQSAFRREQTLKKWTALMFILGEIWEGSMQYNWALNDVICHLERLE